MNYKAPYKLEKKKGDQGYDLRAIRDYALLPGDTVLIDTGVYFEFDEGFYGDVRGRSSLSAKGIKCDLGLVDSSYRGEIKVSLYNASHIPYPIDKGDRIGQLVICKEIDVDLDRVEVISDDTHRGTKGFGSSGK